MRGESGLTASDVALLSGRNGNNDGFGDGTGAWWIIIFIIFAFMGRSEEHTSELQSRI